MAQKKTSNAREEFQKKRAETFGLRELLRRKDSLAHVRFDQYLDDSLRSIGSSLEYVRSLEKIRRRKADEERAALQSKMAGQSAVGILSTVNLGFEDDFSGYIGEVSAEFRSVPGVNAAFSSGRFYYNQLDLTGQVTYPATAASFPNGIPNFSPTNNSGARHKIFDVATNKNDVDAYGGFPILPPFVGSKVARLGNLSVGNSPSPASGALYEREALYYSFTVDAATPYIVINYAVVFQDPSAYGNHIGDNKTYFRMELIKPDNSIVDCATYEVYTNNSSESKIPGFLASPRSAYIKYKPWSSSILDLSSFVGQTITLKYSGGDCLYGGHNGYAYVDAYATSKIIYTKVNGVEVSSICAGLPVEFSTSYTGRYVDETYLWDFGDGTTSTERNPVKIFSSTGVKTVSLKINVVGGSVNPCDVFTTITVIPGANANFTINDLTPAPSQSLTLTLTSPVAGSTNTIQWGDNTAAPVTIAGSTATKSYAKPGTYILTVNSVNGQCADMKQLTLDVVYLCASDLPGVTGTFQLDRVTGNIVYTRTGCPSQALFTCVSGVATKRAKVVSATATTFSDSWPYAERFADNSGVAFAASTNAFERSERGKWRAKSTYMFNTSLVAEDKNHTAGTYELTNFNWKNPANNNKTKWLLGTEVTAYSPNGDALSEKNILGIESSAKFGYNNTVPYLTAKNASYSSILFESFEQTYKSGNSLEDKMKTPTAGYRDDSRQPSNYAHSGLHSWRLPAGGTVDVAEFALSSGQLSKGLQVKLWLRLENLAAHGKLTDNSTPRPLQLKVKGQTIAGIPFKVVARTGEWTLVEANITSFGTVQAGKPFSLAIEYSPSEVIWIDDIRVQPIDSEMTCYVYNKTNLRLLAIFDDQHFGLYYQYSAEGKLVRKIKETERGVKTIQETQYNTLKK